MGLIKNEGIFFKKNTDVNNIDKDVGQRWEA